MQLHYVDRLTLFVFIITALSTFTVALPAFRTPASSNPRVAAPPARASAQSSQRGGGQPLIPPQPPLQQIVNDLWLRGTGPRGKSIKNHILAPDANGKGGHLLSNYPSGTLSRPAASHVLKVTLPQTVKTVWDDSTGGWQPNEIEQMCLSALTRLLGETPTITQNYWNDVNTVGVRKGSLDKRMIINSRFGGICIRVAADVNGGGTCHPANPNSQTNAEFSPC